LGAAYSTLQANGTIPILPGLRLRSNLPADVMWDSPAVEHYDEGVSEDSR
jgi:hypothetical protein